jgi:hypothetical protein
MITVLVVAGYGPWPAPPKEAVGLEPPSAPDEPGEDEPGDKPEDQMGPVRAAPSCRPMPIIRGISTSGPSTHQIAP